MTSQNPPKTSQNIRDEVLCWLDASNQNSQHGQTLRRCCGDSVRYDHDREDYFDYLERRRKAEARVGSQLQYLKRHGLVMNWARKYWRLTGAGLAAVPEARRRMVDENHRRAVLAGTA